MVTNPKEGSLGVTTTRTEATQRETCRGGRGVSGQLLDSLVLGLSYQLLRSALKHGRVRDWYPLLRVRKLRLREVK